MVMLTLTEDNVGDVIPLGLMLEGLADSFNFNRLSSVGEGASLRLPEPKRFEEFLREYLKVSREHEHMRLKDNLFNILLHKEGQPLRGGCTGYGCGAAFNFITLLADGEVHACRKFPSLVGNIYERGLEEIYSSPMAERYRLGCAECEPCPIRPVCGGCLAVSHGLGMDGLRQKDRYCFFDSSSA
jgi:selenobiotic family peptide radical SAM maturase